MLGLTCHRLDLTLRHTSPAVASAGRDVALVIRSCAREHATIYQTARHLCEQLEGPHVFGRRALLCDIPPPSALRDADAEKQWRRQAERLRAEGVITQVFYASSAPAAVREHNVRWMGLDSEQTHSAGRSAPLSSTFQALQAVEGWHSYCVLLDSDMLVARLGRPRDRYLADMKGMLQRDAALLAVALPTREAVCRGPVPCGKLEVRGALIDLRRLTAALPLPLGGASDDGAPHLCGGVVQACACLSQRGAGGMSGNARGGLALRLAGA